MLFSKSRVIVKNERRYYMTVTMQNVDVPFFEVLKSLVNLHKGVVLQKVEEEKKSLSPSEEHIKQINAVYAKVQNL